MGKDTAARNTKDTILSASGVVFLLLIAFLCTDCGKTDSGKTKQPKEAMTMGGTALRIEKTAAIPPIDARGPARVETATFSLG